MGVSGTPAVKSADVITFTNTEACYDQVQFDKCALHKGNQFQNRLERSEKKGISMETSNFFVCVPVERANDIELFFKVRHFKTSADARFHRKRGETVRCITVDVSGAYLGCL